MAEVHVMALGQRVARKRLDFTARTATFDWIAVDPDWLGALGLAASLGLVAYGVRRGSFVLVVRRPAHATIVAVASVSLVVTPKVWAGGGGDAELYWELADPLGTSFILLDEAGERAYEMAVTPFGSVRQEWGQATWMRSMYAGHQYDEPSGLVYMGARWYEPGAGVFMGVDPIVGAAGDPQQHNAYAYSRNNPVANGDSTGMVGECIRCPALFQAESPTWTPVSIAPLVGTGTKVDSEGNKTTEKFTFVYGDTFVATWNGGRSGDTGADAKGEDSGSPGEPSGESASTKNSEESTSPKSRDAAINQAKRRAEVARDRYHNVAVGSWIIAASQTIWERLFGDSTERVNSDYEATTPTPLGSTGASGSFWVSARRSPCFAAR